MFTKLEYIHDLNSNNRTLHPALPLRTLPSPEINIDVDISPLKSRLMYSFRAYFSNSHVQNMREKKIEYGVFIKFPADTTSDICRVEKDTFFNMLVGSDPWSRFFVLVLLVFSLTIAATLLRK